VGIVECIAGLFFVRLGTITFYCIVLYCYATQKWISYRKVHNLQWDEYSFYRATLCIRGTGHGPVSVGLSVSVSVTSRSSTKTAKSRIT